MNTLVMKFNLCWDDTGWNETIELEINYIPAGIVNILYEGKAPNLEMIKIINENYTDIVNAVIAEQTRLAWELREKAWDTPEKKPYHEIEEFITNTNKIQRQIGG